MLHWLQSGDGLEEAKRPGRRLLLQSGLERGLLGTWKERGGCRSYLESKTELGEEGRGMAGADMH